MGFFDTILWPFWWFNSTIMVGFESFLVFLGMSPDNGWTWVLAIVGLVVVLRMLLIPIFVKQIRAQRKTQLLQPDIMKIRAKYKGKKDEASRKAMGEETMALYKDNGTNPFASCMPMLLQMPFFFALFRMLFTVPDVANGVREPVGFFTIERAIQMRDSTVFGSPLTESFFSSTGLAPKVLAGVLIVAMSATTFITQYQVMRKNMPAAALDNPFARQQKIMLYLFPAIFLVTGVHFPIGVLFYWTTTNLWTMGQQFIVIRNMPAPGSAAEKAREARLKAKGKVPDVVQVTSEEEKAAQAPVGQRPQPKSHKRNKPSSKKKKKKR